MWVLRTCEVIRSSIYDSWGWDIEYIIKVETNSPDHNFKKSISLLLLEWKEFSDAFALKWDYGWNLNLYLTLNIFY